MAYTARYVVYLQYDLWSNSQSYGSDTIR